MTDVIPSHAEHLLLAAHTSGEQGTYARMLCHRHAAALLTMASMVLDDLDTAGDIVASTIAAASRDRDREPSAETPTRMELARSCITVVSATRPSWSDFRSSTARTAVDRPHPSMK